MPAPDIPTYSADLLAKELYNNIKVVDTLSKKLGTSLKTNNLFDISLLREFLNENPERIKDVNEVIHPLVKAKFIEIINKTPAKVAVF